MDRRTFIRRGLAAGAATALVARPALGQTLYPLTAMRLDLYNYANATNSHLRQDGTDEVAFDTLRIESFIYANGVPTEFFYSHLAVWTINGTGARSQDRLKAWGEVNFDQQGLSDVRGVKGKKVVLANQDLTIHNGLWMIEADIRRPAPNNGEVIFSKSVTFRKV